MRAFVEKEARCCWGFVSRCAGHDVYEVPRFWHLRNEAR